MLYPKNLRKYQLKHLKNILLSYNVPVSYLDANHYSDTLGITTPEYTVIIMPKYGRYYADYVCNGSTPNPLWISGTTILGTLLTQFRDLYPKLFKKQIIAK